MVLTTQFPEILKDSKIIYTMDEEPLGAYLHEKSLALRFSLNTALRRGYQGTWSVRGDVLRLESLNGELDTGEKLTLKTIFPHGMSYETADWYSGVLNCVSGTRFATPFGFTFERELRLHVERGQVIRSESYLNKLAEADCAGPGLASASSRRIMIRDRESKLFADHTAGEIIDKFGRLKTPDGGVTLSSDAVVFFNTLSVDDGKYEALAAYTHMPNAIRGTEYRLLWKIILAFRLTHGNSISERTVRVSHDSKDHNSMGDPVFSTTTSDGPATASFCSILLYTPEERAENDVKDLFERV